MSVVCRPVATVDGSVLEKPDPRRIKIIFFMTNGRHCQSNTFAFARVHVVANFDADVVLVHTRVLAHENTFSTRQVRNVRAESPF